MSQIYSPKGKVSTAKLVYHKAGCNFQIAYISDKIETIKGEQFATTNYI
nr:12273_t:CDS:2 [Entrophospora candida]